MGMLLSSRKRSRVASAPPVMSRDASRYDKDEECDNETTADPGTRRRPATSDGGRALQKAGPRPSEAGDLEKVADEFMMKSKVRNPGEAYGVDLTADTADDMPMEVDLFS